MSQPNVTVCLLAWLAVASSCADLPQVSARPAAKRPLSAPARSSPAPELRLGAWNLRKYGFEAQKDDSAIAAIIKEHFDLIALLEVVSSPNERALAELAALLAPEFALAATSAARPSPSTMHSEHYVIAYRPERIAPCAELPALTYFDDGPGSDGSASRGLFLREPAFACFRTAGAPGFDLVLAAYHAEWGEGDAQGIASEVRHIDSVFAAMQRALPGEQLLYMIGDFNLGSAALTPLTAARDRTLGTGSTLDARGEISANLYDHLLALGAAANAALAEDARVLDVRGEAFDPAHFRDRISDHLPILAQLRLSEDDD